METRNRAEHASHGEGAGGSPSTHAHRCVALAAGMYACAQVRGSGGGDVSGSSAVIFSVKHGSHQLTMRSGVVMLEVS